MADLDIHLQFVAIECPKCGEGLEVSLKEIINHDTAECPQCRHNFSLEPFDYEYAMQVRRNKAELEKLKSIVFPENEAGEEK